MGVPSGAVRAADPGLGQQWGLTLAAIVIQLR